MQLKNQLDKAQYDFIISYGQKSVIKDKIYIETVGRLHDNQYLTNFNYLFLLAFIQTRNYPVKISTNAGTSYSNHIYYHGLHKINMENLNTRIIFIHIPLMKNIVDINTVIDFFIGYIALMIK